MILPTEYAGKSVAVFGLGKDGFSAVRALYAADVDVFAWDDSEQGRKNLHEGAFFDEVQSSGAVTIQAPESWPWKQIEALILSPGIPLTHPTPHPVVGLAKAAGVPIICTIELLYQSCPESRYIGITGTNGKSTTTALIGHILKHAGMPTEVGGNIGIPAMDLRPLDHNGTYVLEMSSYQLDLLEIFTPDISLLLNITPDHIDRHGDLQGYIAAKMHMFERQSANHTAVIAVDNDESRKIYEKLVAEKKIGRLVPVSSITPQKEGVAVIDGVLHINLTGRQKTVELGYLDHLAGQHNAENMAAAVAIAVVAGVSTDAIISGIKSFVGLPHRMQYVKEIEGVRFINDSKATNAEAAEKALRTFRNIHWIIGGRAKAGGISSLKPLFDRISHAYIIGECAKEFAATLDEAGVPYTQCEVLEKATKEAARAAFASSSDKPVVLLSPATASFDQWPSFEVRGKSFCEYVEALEPMAQKKA
ncbi:MAG: murD [Rickettsiales bacterium]|jgi:UDP-N-acetylmuramoylalanine--D-glutamate ligase|nr:murD [Rickettsiales bacterium]